MMDSDSALPKGIVELDETYMGGTPLDSIKPQPPAPIPLFEEPEAEKPAKVDGRRKRTRGRGADKRRVARPRPVAAVLSKRTYGQAGT
jgi:hypothetical protein